MNKTKPNLLLVDDDPVFRRLMSVLLTQEGFNVVTADNAEDGLHVIDKREFQVAVIDYKLPGLSGIDFFERSRRSHPLMSRILLTAYTTEAVLLDAINRGEVFRYILKPVHTDLLLSSVDQAMALHELAVSRAQLMEQLESQNQELKQRNEDLRLAYNQLEDMKMLQDQILSVLPEPVYLIGETNRIIGCNRAACQLCGYSRAELLGRIVSELFGDAIDRLRANPEVIAGCSLVTTRLDIKNKDGATSSYETDMHILRSGEEKQFKMAMLVKGEGR